MAARHKSVETKYMEDRDAVLRGLRRLDRRTRGGWAAELLQREEKE